MAWIPNLQKVKVERIIPKHIRRKATIQKFGYDPCFLKPSSEKMVLCKCVLCKSKRVKKFRHAVKQKICLHCSNKQNAVTSATKRSISMKLFYTNGGKHGMSGRKQSAKAIAAIRRMNAARRGMKHPWYGKCRHGKVTIYQSKNNGKVRLRSSYELAFAKYLDSRDIDWKYEPKVFPITYKLNGEIREGTYRPDFLLTKSNTFVEVKGWWRGDAKPKYKACKNQYNIKLKVVGPNQLKELGLITR